jgi:hypothetical protein
MNIRLAIPLASPWVRLAHWAPGQIANLFYTPALQTAKPVKTQARFTFKSQWPTGADESRPDEARLDELRQKILAFKEEQDDARDLAAGLDSQAEPLAFHRARHKEIRLVREILELKLSILLNQMKSGEGDEKTRELIRSLGKLTNLARRNRRTYDYILSLFEYA